MSKDTFSAVSMPVFLLYSIPEEDTEVVAISLTKILRFCKVAERPMYFSSHGALDGTDVLGYTQGT